MPAAAIQMAGLQNRFKALKSPRNQAMISKAAPARDSLNTPITWGDTSAGAKLRAVPTVPHSRPAPSTSEHPMMPSLEVVFRSFIARFLAGLGVYLGIKKIDKNRVKTAVESIQPNLSRIESDFLFFERKQVIILQGTGLVNDWLVMSISKSVLHFKVDKHRR